MKNDQALSSNTSGIRDNHYFGKVGDFLNRGFNSEVQSKILGLKEG